jgi:uncharacterized protein YjbJ (UPF0337 family)
MSEERIEGAARNGLGHVEDGFGGLVGDAKTQAKGKLNQAIGSMQNAYGKALDHADEALDDVQGHAEALVSDLQAYVREKPLLSLGVALMAGALLWQLIGGGRKVIYVRK